MQIKRSRRELSIDMVIHRIIIKNNHIALLACLTFTPKHSKQNGLNYNAAALTPKLLFFTSRVNRTCL